MVQAPACRRGADHEPRRPDPLSRFVHKLAARSPLGAAERAAVLALNGLVRQYEANRDIVAERERVGHAAFVVSGLVASFGQTRPGLRQITALHLAGEMANLHSVMVPEASEALQALSVTTVVQVAHAELRDLADCYPALAAAFWRESVVRNAIASQWLINLGRRPALARMAHLFCEWACRSDGGEGWDGLGFTLLATQVHLADMLGLTPVHVNRTLRQLRDDGLIHYSGRVVTICDWSGLARLAEFDGSYLQLRSADAVDGSDRLAAAASGAR